MLKNIPIGKQEKWYICPPPNTNYEYSTPILLGLNGTLVAGYLIQ